MVDKPKAPLKPRTGYHIFLRLESRRLKTILGQSSGSQNLREMAVAAWRCLPEKDKLVIYLCTLPMMIFHKEGNTIVANLTYRSNLQI